MWPGGIVVDSLVVNRDWFRGPEGWDALLYGLQADSRGLIWAARVAPEDELSVVILEALLVARE